MKRLRFALIIASSLAALSGIYVASGSAEERELIPQGRGIGTRQHPPQSNAQPGGGSAANNAMVYHGGPVMTGSTNAYYIWYGDWSNNTAPQILTELGQHIGGSPYFNINTTYYNGSNVHVSNSVSLAGQYVFKYTTQVPYKTTLTDGDIQAIVASTINGGGMAYDAHGVYFVLTSPEIRESSGFCTNYCGWHTHFNLNGNDVKYAFVGDAATQCPSACIEQTASPNGNAGADGMASVLSHELEEAVTDPDLNAWYDRRGNENADKCAWTFGSTYIANGARANMKLGVRDFLIQQNWVHVPNAGYCAKSY